jgi:fumarylacetoacetase
MSAINETHDPNRRSWIETANTADTDFPIQNLPLCVFHTAECSARGGIGIGDQILDLRAGLEAGLFSGIAAEAAKAGAGATLNDLMSMGSTHNSALRRRVSELLTFGSKAINGRDLALKVLVPMNEADLELPAFIRSFTDFSCSMNHMRRMGGGNVRPVFMQLPVGYHGRASSLCVSDTPVVRPCGQFSGADGSAHYGPEPNMDFELELGAYIGVPNAIGEPISIRNASDHIFGFALVNDWSARGIQIFESALGPFLGKSFLTTVSPWIVTQEALAPFRVPAVERGPSEIAVPQHLSDAADRHAGGIDIELSTYFQSERMRREGKGPERIVHSNFSQMYWTFAQMLAHHTSNGCNLEAGDLLASGTVSGTPEDAKGCLMEINGRGQTPLRMQNGETRLWLEDGDEVSFRARASRPGFVSIGFGRCDGRVLPAKAIPS